MRAISRGIVTVTMALGVIMFGASAGADSGTAPVLSTGLPPITWFHPRTTGDSASVASDAMGAFAFEPLRLSLLGEHALVPTNQCGDQFVDARVGGSPLLRMGTFGANLVGGSSLRSPRLSLFGFSRMGCALDGAAGAGFTFTLPITRQVAFATSAGAILVPGAPAGSERSSGGVRMGVVFRGSSGRSFNVGIGNRGMTFGGRF